MLFVCYEAICEFESMLCPVFYKSRVGAEGFKNLFPIFVERSCATEPFRRVTLHSSHRCAWEVNLHQFLVHQLWQSLEFWLDLSWLLRFSLPGFSPLMPRLLCDLERFTNGYRISGPFVSELWLSFEISVTLIAFLDTFSQARLHLCCVVLQVDRTEIGLGATEKRLQIQLESWGVPTPPVQPCLPRVPSDSTSSFSSFDGQSDWAHSGKRGEEKFSCSLWAHSILWAIHEKVCTEISMAAWFHGRFRPVGIP